MLGLIWAVIVILVILWLIGWLAFHLGPLIFLLLVAAVIILILRLVL